MSIKKDIEVQLQDISRKIEDNKKLIDQKTEELKDDLFLSLESVRKREESLSEEYKSKRERKYQNYAEKLEKLTPEERLKEQRRATLFHLNKADNMTVAKLKKMLQKIDLYQGVIDEEFDKQLAQSISNFQQQYGVTPIDGIAGFKTLSKLSEIIQNLSETKPENKL